MKTNLRVAKIQAADRARAAYTQKNAGKEGYSLKALEQIANGTYRKNQTQNKVPELKPNTQAKMPTKTTTKATGNLRDQGYPSSRSYNRKNLSDRGYTGSQQTRQIDFNHVLKNDKVFGDKGVFSGNMLKEDLKARRKGKQYGTNEAYYKRFGMSADEVLDQYEKYMKGKEREKAEKHPILTALKDVPSALDRSYAGAAGTLAKMAFPNSDLDEVLNSDAIQGKVRDVQERRDYIQDSRKLSDSTKALANLAAQGGDTTANILESMLLAGTGMPAQIIGGASGAGLAAQGEGILASTGFNSLSEGIPNLMRVLNGVAEYGRESQEKKHEYERRGYDEETANSLGNAEGIASGAIMAALSGGGAAGEIAKGYLPAIKTGTASGAKFGGGRQLASEIIEPAILGEDSNFGKAKQKYLAQGMSEAEATIRALAEAGLRVGGATATGGVAGGVLGGAGYGLSQLLGGNANVGNLNEFMARQEALPMNDNLALPQNDIPALDGMINQLALPEQQLPANVIELPGTNGTIELPDLNAPIANQVANQVATKNPTLTISAEEIAQAKTRHKDLSKQLVTLNKEIAKQQELFDSFEGKKSKGAERKAAGQKLAEMKKQAKAIQQEKSELSYQMKGEERPYKRYMQDYDKDAYNAIYGQNGIMGKLDYATHFAGDTPEAIALRDEIKKVINDTVQSGEFPDEADLWNKVAQLDNMASTAKQPFTSTKGKNYDYDTFFAPSNTDEYSGLNMDVVNGYHSALRSHSNKAVTDRITDALNSDTFNPVTITGDNGQQYRIEKGDEGFNLITLGEDGNPVWLDKYKTPNDLFKKLNKIEKGGVKLLDKALSEQSVPQVAGKTAPVSRSYKDLIPENAYFNSDSFRALADNAKEADQKLTNLKNTRTQLEELLAKETIGPKPEEEWTPDEYIKSLGYLGEKPMLYTPEGEKIRKSIANVDNEIHTLRAREEEIREGKTALKNKASKEQLANYTFKAPTPATQTEYPGFDITKATHNDEVQDAINNGTAFIAEMSPLEYLDRAAHEIFTDSTLESTIMSANSLKEVSQYADAMRNGAQFPILDLRYNSKSGRGQEGLTRALAAYEAGIDKVPVAIIGEPSLNPYNGRPDDIEIDDFGIPEADINEAVAEAVAESYAQDNALTPEEIDYLNNHMETLDDEIVPIEEETETPDNGYWLRILGDPDFLMEEAQKQGVNPQALVGYANNNLGYENIPRVTPNIPNGGDIPPETPHMDGMMPGDHTKTSQTYTNTGRYGGGWTEEEYNKYTDPSQFQYNDVSEQESVDNAIQMRTTEGREGFKNRVMAKEKLTGSEIDGLMMEWRDLTREARELEESGKDAAALWAEGVKVFRKVQEQESHNAQALQVLAKWSRNTPEGMLVQAENIVNGKTKPEQTKLQQELEKFTKGKKKFQFDDNFVAEFLKEAEEIQALTPNSPLAKDRMAELGRKVNRQLPSTLGEKLTSFLMDNMLGNFRTLITRNAGGNVGLNAIEQLVQRPVAAGIDMLASVRTGKRTQAGLSREGLAEYIHGFSKGLQDELHDLKTGLHTARTGENTIERAIQANRHVFREGGPMDRWDSLIKNGLSVGDRPFYEAVYNQTLGDYKRLRSSGKMGDVVQGLSDTDFNKYAETAAKLNALAAVYQNDSKLADALLGFKKSIGDLSRGIVGVDVLSQFSMPFVKTPANVVDVGVSYSPIGVVRNAFRTGKEIKDEAFDQNRFANETARNILGTAGLTAGGIALAKSGVLSGAYSKDTDEKQAQKEAGEQEYAWNVPEVLPGIGGKQMDISWLPAVGANLVASAAAYDAYENGEGNPIQNFVKGAEAGGQALFNQSMFQGLQRLFGTGEAYNSDEGIVANMGNVVKSGLSQFVPSLARQVGQVMDPYQRDVGNSNEGKSFGPLDSYGINNIANTIPKVREKALAPKVNTSGELMKENQGRNVGMKVLEDMILPGKITDVDYNRLSEEAMRLSNLTTNNTAFMPKADRSNVDTETHTLSNQEWVDYQQKYYKTLTNAGEKLLDSTYYKNAETSEQEKMLSNTYSDLRSAINSEYNGKEVDGAAKRYIDAGGGEKGVLEVLKYEMNSIEANKLDMTVPTYEKKQAEYPGGAKKYAENKKKADALGLTVDTYDKKQAEYTGGAKQYVEDKKKADELGITVDQFNKAKSTGGAEKFAADKKAAEQAGFVNKSGSVQTADYQKALDKAGKQWRKMENDLPALVNSGLDKSAIYTYGNALNSQYASSINPSEYARQYNTINTNKDNGMTQKEMLDYLNKGSYTQEEANRLWTIYGDGWKQVPVLQKGTWKKKKK